MALTTIYVVRHGFRSNWDPDVTVPPPPPTGITGDPSLSNHGREQAEELAQFVASLQPPVQAIISSPFYRCVETARPSALATGLPVHLDNGVAEWYSRSRVTHPSPASPEVLQQFFPDIAIAKDYEPTVVPSTEGETYQELEQRCAKALAQLIDRFSDREAILICTHAATKIVIGRALLNDPNLMVRAGTCSIDKYTLNGNQWTIEWNGLTSFLSMGEERHWDFEQGDYALLDAPAQSAKEHPPN
ncbi:hypothetical protein CANCADRAFT_27754 [Tortispora caseinolytica NRRL Y-17796]|uniref:Phosphoglycerate mutase-like protein n=1 Tax=Tortispora caseinolytica NRRL Y-17796 TaxID=767744 RepID=A0A1E4TDH6_9ASCO|nr:hypothetical protein CANCADRAFT_27754 [Tortispora caseinolytica NRRL Y-17796]